MDRLVKKPMQNRVRETSARELRAHQRELEMRCHELQETQLEVEESRDQYRELYESLP